MRQADPRDEFLKLRRLKQAVGGMNLAAIGIAAEKDDAGKVGERTKEQERRGVGRDDDPLFARIDPVAGDRFHLLENERLELGMKRDFGLVDDESSDRVIVDRGKQRNELGDPACLERTDSERCRTWR